MLLSKVFNPILVGLLSYVLAKMQKCFSVYSAISFRGIVFPQTKDFVNLFSINFYQRSNLFNSGVPKVFIVWAIF